MLARCSPLNSPQEQALRAILSVSVGTAPTCHEKMNVFRHEPRSARAVAGTHRLTTFVTQLCLGRGCPGKTQVFPRGPSREATQETGYDGLVRVMPYIGIFSWSQCGYAGDCSVPDIAYSSERSRRDCARQASRSNVRTYPNTTRCSMTPLRHRTRRNAPAFPLGRPRVEIGGCRDGRVPDGRYRSWIASPDRILGWAGVVHWLGGGARGMGRCPGTVSGEADERPAKRMQVAVI